MLNQLSSRSKRTLRIKLTRGKGYAIRHTPVITFNTKHRERIYVKRLNARILRGYALHCDTEYSNTQCTCEYVDFRLPHWCSVTQQSRHRLRQTTFPANSFCRYFDAAYDLPTITRDQGRTGAVINCIKLRRSRGKGDKIHCNDHLSIGR